MKNLKLLTVIALIFLLVVGVTACGGKGNSVKDTSEPGYEKQQGNGDVLANSTYRLTEEVYDDDSMIPDHKLVDEYKFADDGTFKRSYQTMSVVMVDNGLEPKWNNAEETGTYTIEGDKVSIIGSQTGETEMSLENGDLVKNSEEQDITGNTLKVRRVYTK